MMTDNGNPSQVVLPMSIASTPGPEAGEAGMKSMIFVCCVLVMQINSLLGAHQWNKKKLNNYVDQTFI